MAQEETLSELVLGALLRRIAVMIGLHTGLSIIGSSYSADSCSSAPTPTPSGSTASSRSDRTGFILTGHDTPATSGPGPGPLPLETTIPGVFAAGDVRSGSIKRVASAVGEGAMAVRLIHDHLARQLA